jgi:hypothetical protein
LQNVIIRGKEEKSTVFTLGSQQIHAKFDKMIYHNKAFRDMITVGA